MLYRVLFTLTLLALCAIQNSESRHKEKATKPPKGNAGRKPGNSITTSPSTATNMVEETETTMNAELPEVDQTEVLTARLKIRPSGKKNIKKPNAKSVLPSTKSHGKKKVTTTSMRRPTKKPNKTKVTTTSMLRPTKKPNKTKVTTTTVRSGTIQKSDKTKTTTTIVAPVTDVANETEEPLMPNKSWPEAVGMKSEEAKEFISSDFPEADFEVINISTEGETADLHSHRVKLYVDDDDTVVRIPTNG